MKFAIREAAIRYAAPPRINSWQVYFAWWPRRIDSITVVWMELVARRPSPSTRHRTIGALSFYIRAWTYGPIAHAITQPGHAFDKNYSSATARQLVASASISSQQAGSTALQSGLSGPARQSRQDVPISRDTYASGPPPGGLNPPPPKSRP